MLEQIWRHDTEILDTDDKLRPILEQIAAIPEFVPVDYDLNQKEQWRDFDAERTLVDGLTQRTQLLRIRGEGEGEVAMVAMGKHGEEPTTVIRLSEERRQRLDAYVDAWDALFDEVSLRVALITSPTWRQTLDQAGITWEDAAITPAMVLAWPRRGIPAVIEQLEAELAADGPAHLDQRRFGQILWLAPDGDLEGRAHRRQIGRIAERLSSG